MDMIRRWHFTVENQVIVSLFALCNMFVFRNALTVLLDTDNYTNVRSTLKHSLYLEVNIYSLVKDHSEDTLYKHTS